MDLQPISTTNLLSIFQILIIVAGFVFSWKSLVATQRSISIASENLKMAATNINTAMSSLNLATQNAQAQLYNQFVVQGRDLQFKHMDIFLEGDRDAKKSMFLGSILSYYSACFELRRVLNLPEFTVTLLDNELKELLREKPVRQKFEEQKHLFSREFNDHVSQLYGVKTK